MTRRPLARAASGVYRSLLRIAAPDIRGAYADDMRETFAALADEAAGRNAFALAGLLVRESLDLLRARRMPMPSSSDPRTAMAAGRDFWHSGRVIQAIRSLRRRSGFALTAVLALATGTAATTAVFTIIDTVVIKPLPYPNADRLVAVLEASPADRERTSLVAPVRLEDWQQMTRTFVSVSGLYSEALTDTSGPTPERLDGRRVSARYFTVFNASPLAGRTFTEDEERFGGPGAAIISETFWARRFQRSDRAIGQALTIGGRSYAVVGVMPAGFAATTIDVWLPAQVPPGLMQVRDARFMTGIGRLKPGVSVAEAREDLDRVQRDLGATYPKTDAGWSAEVWDLKDYRVGEQGRGLWLVFGAVGLLWLITMTNVAGLVLIETHRRARELAIRLSIGASRAHVVGVVVQEVLVLAAAGVGVGLLAAAWLVSIARSELTTLPRVSELALDWRAAVFAAATGVLAAGLCGLVPALMAMRRRPASLVASGVRVVGGSAHRWQRGLVAAQVALSLLLSASAALLARSYYNLTHIDSGYQTENVITFHVGARWDEDRTRVGQLQTALLDAMGRVPGVQSAGLSSFLPATNATLRYKVKVDGIGGPGGAGTVLSGQRTISVGYLKTIGVPLVAGDWCPALEADMNAPRTVVVNRQFAERLAGGQDLIGRQMHYEEVPGPPLTITGVVADLAEDGPQAARSPYIYACEAAGTWPDPNYVVRTADPAAFIANLATLVHQIDPSRAVFAVRPLGDILHDAVEGPRLNAGMVGAFAGGAMLLAAIGLYGLFTLLVSESRREIGVRLALGARPRQVMRLVFADAGRLLLAGLVIGLALVLLSTRLLGSVLFGVSGFDPATMAAAIVTLVVVASAAIALPAVRASRVAPTEALRAD